VGPKGPRVEEMVLEFGPLRLSKEISILDLFMMDCVGKE